MRVFTCALAMSAFIVMLPVSGAVLFSDDFSGDTGGLTKTSLVNWNVLNGTNVDIGDFGGQCSPGPQQCVDMQGSFGASSGDIETKLSFALGPAFNYSFFYTIDNAAASSVRLRIGSAVNVLLPTVSGAYELQFTSLAQNATIRLTDESNPDNVGAYIGNIVLQSEPVLEPIPEPSTMLLLSGGFAGLAFLRRRAA